MKDLYVELKVCEGCGGLWLRARELKQNGRGAYCSSCMRWLAEFPAPKRSRSRNEAQRKRRQRNRAAKTGAVVELVGVGGGR
jgi:Zn-finger nucleic acid-binding protein